MLSLPAPAIQVNEKIFKEERDRERMKEGEIKREREQEKGKRKEKKADNCFSCFQRTNDNLFGKVWVRVMEVELRLR